MFSCWGRSIGSLVFPQGWREAFWCLPVGDTSLPPSLDVLHWWWLCVCSYGSCEEIAVQGSLSLQVEAGQCLPEGGVSGVVDPGEYICSSGWHGGCNILCCSPPALCHQLSCRDVGADYRAGLGFLWYWVEETDTITFYFCWFLNWEESLSSALW